MGDTVRELAPYLLSGVALVADVWAVSHALLYRRDVRSTIAWFSVIVLLPLLGASLYLVLGINRIKRRALKLRGEPSRAPQASVERCPAERVCERVDAPHMRTLIALVDRVVHSPVTAGNHVSLLVDGDEAYAAMIAAIDAAARSVALTTYIFDNDRAGARFVDALARAHERGVEVRVLIDAVGARYSRPPITRSLARAGVPCALFLATRIPGRLRYINLRTHRKIMVVDGRLGFTGGMNIREGTLLSLQPRPRHPIADLHAKIEGPVVAQLQETFADDWEFAARERLEGDAWFPALSPAGEVFARGIPDGPDEDFEELRMTLLGALAVAQRRVQLVTPYFVPDATLISALNIAALRGVRIDIVLPERGNLRLVQWASAANLWQVLERGCKVWLTPPPFDHTKLMVVDDVWTLIGSGNWDARSLRLNFEFNLECYDQALAADASELVSRRIAAARELQLDEVLTRPLPVRVRDGLARLLSPYL